MERTVAIGTSHPEAPGFARRTEISFQHERSFTSLTPQPFGCEAPHTDLEPFFERPVQGGNPRLRTASESLVCRAEVTGSSCPCWTMPGQISSAQGAIGDSSAMAALKASSRASSFPASLSSAGGLGVSPVEADASGGPSETRPPQRHSRAPQGESPPRSAAACAVHPTPCPRAPRCGPPRRPRPRAPPPPEPLSDASPDTPAPGPAPRRGAATTEPAPSSQEESARCARGRPHAPEPPRSPRDPAAPRDAPPAHPRFAPATRGTTQWRRRPRGDRARRNQAAIWTGSSPPTQPVPEGCRSAASTSRIAVRRWSSAVSMGGAGAGPEASSFGGGASPRRRPLTRRSDASGSVPGRAWGRGCLVA